MYELLGQDAILQTIHAVARPFLRGRASTRDLRSGYLSFLSQIQPEIPRPSTKDIALISDQRQVAPYLAAFDTQADENASQKNFDVEKERVAHSLKQLGDLFHLVVHTIFFSSANEIKGGSNADAIGVLWINPRPHWSEQDLKEILVHESVHNLLFLDELVHEYFPDYLELLKEENYIWSPSRHEMRPLDKVFHAIVVNTELLLLRDRTGHPKGKSLHPASEKMSADTANSIEAIKKHPRCLSLMTDRSREILDLCHQNLQICK